MDADEIGQILDELGERLGPAGEYVFQLAVRQQLISGWIALAIFSVLFLLGTCLTWLSVSEFWKGYTDKNKGPYEDGYLAWLGGAFLGSIVAFIGLIELLQGLKRILNPEWYALTDILSRIIPSN